MLSHITHLFTSTLFDSTAIFIEYHRTKLSEIDWSLKIDRDLDNLEHIVHYELVELDTEELLYVLVRKSSVIFFEFEEFMFYEVWSAEFLHNDRLKTDFLSLVFLPALVLELIADVFSVYIPPIGIDELIVLDHYALSDESLFHKVMIVLSDLHYLISEVTHRLCITDYAERRYEQQSSILDILHIFVICEVPLLLRIIYVEHIEVIPHLEYIVLDSMLHHPLAVNDVCGVI